MTTLSRRGRQIPLLWIGFGLAVTLVVSGWALFHKNEIKTRLRSGENIKVHFAAKVPLVPYFSQAKVSFVPVGVVTKVEREDSGAVVTLKVDKGTRAKLGTEPTAVLRPTTLLGGNYFVDLKAGGERGKFSGSIPLARATLPVELDKVAGVFQPQAVKGLQSTVKNLDGAFKAGTGSALDRLAADAPAALRPAAYVLRSVQGQNPKTDLTNLVSGLESTARALNAHQGELDSIITSLQQTTSALSARGNDLATTLSRLPGTLDSTNAGLRRLDTSLTTLRDTADSARPVVAALDTALDHANPVLVDARPVVQSLNTLLTDTQPLVQRLVPTVQGYDSVLNDIKGPVLDRLNGPVKTWLMSPWKGTGPYAGTQTKVPLYQEIAYTLAVANRGAEMSDHNGSHISFQAGVGLDSFGGLPINLTQLFEILTAKLPLNLGIGHAK